MSMKVVAAQPVPALTIMTVMCPQNAQAGSQVIVPTPDGQQIMVTVPPGVVSGQNFQVQLSAPALPTANNNGPLDQIVAAAGGQLLFSAPTIQGNQGIPLSTLIPLIKVERPALQADVTIQDASGATIATIKMTGEGNPVNIVLPDGSVALTVNPVGNRGKESLRGNAGGSFGDCQAGAGSGINCLELLVCCCGAEQNHAELRPGNQQPAMLSMKTPTERSLDVNNPMLDDNESSAYGEVSYVANPVTVDRSTITQTDTPPIKTMIVIANSTVHHGPSLDSAKVGEIDAGMTVDVFEECSRVGHHRCRIGQNEWISAVTSKGHIMARITAHHSKANEPCIKQMIVMDTATVRQRSNLDSVKVGKIQAGVTIAVFEECSIDGHQRCRIGPDEWISAVTARGHIIALGKANEPCIKQMIVMDTATVRQGPNLDSVKVGEIQAGVTIAVFEECSIDGHQRCRIGPDEWISAVTARGHVIARNAASVPMTRNPLVSEQNHAELRPGNQQPAMLSMKTPRNPLIALFVYASMGMGAFFVPCMLPLCGPSSYFFQGGTRVGEANQPCCFGQETVMVKSSDPAILRASINLVAYLQYFRLYVYVNQAG
jgi:uncharacterized protein YgiM (DUF1202 family)